MTYVAYVYLHEGGVISVQTSDDPNSKPLLADNGYEIHKIVLGGELVEASELIKNITMSNGIPVIGE